MPGKSIRIQLGSECGKNNRAKQLEKVVPEAAIEPVRCCNDIRCCCNQQLLVDGSSQIKPLAEIEWEGKPTAGTYKNNRMKRNFFLIFTKS